MKHLIKIGATCALNAPINSPFPIRTSDFFATADWLANNDFDSMEVHIRTPDSIDGCKLMDHCKCIGLEISSIGTGMAYGMDGLSITHNDLSIRKAALQRLKDQLDLSVCFNHCPVVIGSMRGTIGPGMTFEQVDQLMVASMTELCEYAEKTGTELVIEAINRDETNYLNTAADVIGLIQRVGSDRVKVHLDTYHMSIEESDLCSPIIASGKMLGHFHAADSNRNYPGSGSIEFLPVISALMRVGYKRSITLECNPLPDGPTAAINGLHNLAADMEKYGTRNLG